MNEVLLYSPIYSSTAADYIAKLNAVDGKGVTVRMNCPGGDVYSAYGMIAKFNELKGSKKIKVDGMAASAGFYMCASVDDVECLDVSGFLVHRAAYPSWVENDKEAFTDELKASLNKTNDKLRAILERKVSSDVFKSVTNVSYDDMFSLDARLDVELTSDQMEALGWVKKINKLTAQKKSEIIALSASYGIAAFSKQTNKDEMDIKNLADLKAQAPQIYKEAIEEERARIEAWMVFNDVDAKAVEAGIKSGKELDRVSSAEFTKKIAAKAALTNLNKDGEEVPAITTEPSAKVEKPQTADVKAESDFWAKVEENLNKNKK